MLRLLYFALHRGDLSGGTRSLLQLQDIDWHDETSSSLLMIDVMICLLAMQ